MSEFNELEAKTEQLSVSEEASSAPTTTGTSCPEDPDASQEDRIAWLRKRGVIIEMPADKGAKTAGAAASSSGEESTERWEDVIAVKIPADERLPYEELTLRVNRNGDGDQLLQVLKPMFASPGGAALDESKLQEAASKQFGNAAMPAISKATLQKLTATGSVESFTLAQPYLETGCFGVNVYLDEAGQLKSLPHNRRASELAALCGFQGVPFAGDVVVGRTHYSTTEGLRNVDFRRADVDSGAAWIRGVVARNYQHGIETNKVGMAESGGSSSTSEDASKGYSVRETEDEVEVVFTLPTEVDGQALPRPLHAAKDVAVHFGRTDLTIALKNTVPDGLAGRVLLHCTLRGAVDRGDCTWTSTAGGKALEITLCKAEGTAAWGGRLEAE